MPQCGRLANFVNTAPNLMRFGVMSQHNISIELCYVYIRLRHLYRLSSLFFISRACFMNWHLLQIYVELLDD